MNRYITQAVEGDKEEILSLYRSMLYGPADWNEDYPNEETIAFDLSRDSLLVMKEDGGKIIAALSIDEDEEVDRLPCWSRELTPGGELARLAVRKDMQNQGIAKEMIRAAFAILKERGMKGVHLLVRPEHFGAQKVYTSLGFQTVGSCQLFDKEFICMERALSE